MYSLPVVSQGYSRAFGKVRPDEAKRAVEWACRKLKEYPGSKQHSIKHLQRTSWGVQQEQFHTGGRYPASGKSLCGNAYEEWSEDIACVLQGTCLPGSTMYCRTKSMFGKLQLHDVIQGTSGVTSRMMSTFSFTKIPGACAFHTMTALKTTKLGQTARKEAYNINVHQAYSTQDPNASGGTQLTQRARLKQAVRDYGSTVIVFHVCISLMSLGGFYLAVSSGLDMQSLLTSIGFSSDVVASRITTGTSTFLIAYGVHKLFAPVRIAMTLACTPFIVRYLRGIGFLKVKAATVPK